MIRVLTFLAVLCLPGAACAQTYPVYGTVFVNDYAEVIAPEVEGRIAQDLKALREDLDVEMTVLTLPTRQGFAPAPSMEDFATNLFNDWGIGNADRNDGILILVLVNDRAMRIELGSGYGNGYNRVAQAVIDRYMLPKFKAGEYSAGIEDGVTATIQEIARPHAAGTKAPRAAFPVADVVQLIFLGLFSSIFGYAIFGGRITDRLRRCPSCGQRGMHTEKKTTKKATRTYEGRGERTRTCRHCDYHDVSTYTISRRSSSSSSGGFGGGSSSGGGASGRW